MPWRRNSGLLYWQFANLSQIPGLYHGVMTRYDRTSGIGRSFNLGLNGVDPPETVWENRNRTLSVFGAQRGIFARQVHGCRASVWPDQKTEIRVPDSDHGRYGRVNGDAIITSSAQNALIIQVADCQSVMMADPIRKVIANVHSGWRGSISNILEKTVDIMTTQWGCRSGDIVCGVGPSLGPCCAEFINYKKELPARYWIYQRHENHFDFWQITKDQLMAKGIAESNIELSYLCSKCNQHLFFSYRGNKRTGRFATLIGLKSQ